jgi:two-component system chemotaxis response regulator CheY
MGETIDKTVLRDLDARLGPDAVQGMISEFAERAAVLARRMKAAQLSGDFGAWGEAAGTLRNAAATLGLRLVSETAEMLEVACRRAAGRAAGQLMSALPERLEDGLRQLDRRYRPDPGGGPEPAAPATAEPAPSAPPRRVSKSARFAELAILLVEDDPFTQRLAANMLRQLGVTRITTAKNGRDALYVLDELGEPVDLIISDWHMPGMTGLDLLRHIRARAITTPFIMLTGDAGRGSVRAAGDQGVIGYIVKPFSLVQLETKIATVLGF